MKGIFDIFVRFIAQRYRITSLLENFSQVISSKLLNQHLHRKQLIKTF